MLRVVASISKFHPIFIIYARVIQLSRAEHTTASALLEWREGMQFECIEMTDMTTWHVAKVVKVLADDGWLRSVRGYCSHYSSSARCSIRYVGSDGVDDTYRKLYPSWTVAGYCTRGLL